MTFSRSSHHHLIGAGRTDAGVHAYQQVARFESNNEINYYEFMRSMRGLLPTDIVVKDLVLVDKDFHPIKSCQSKTYRYQIWTNRYYIDPFLKDFVWHLPQGTDVEKVKALIEPLLGHHNFKSFCATDSTAKTFERTVSQFEVQAEDDLMTFIVSGSGFLKQMVRTMVGTLIKGVQYKYSPQNIVDIINAQDRTKAGPTAPASGLCLYKTNY